MLNFASKLLIDKIQFKKVIEKMLTRQSKSPRKGIQAKCFDAIDVSVYCKWT